MRPLPSLLGLFLVVVQVQGAGDRPLGCAPGDGWAVRPAAPLTRAAHVQGGPPALPARPHCPARFCAVFEGLGVPHSLTWASNLAFLLANSKEKTRGPVFPLMGECALRCLLCFFWTRSHKELNFMWATSRVTPTFLWVRWSPAWKLSQGTTDSSRGEGETQRGKPHRKSAVRSAGALGVTDFSLSPRTR